MLLIAFPVVVKKPTNHGILVVNEWLRDQLQSIECYSGNGDRLVHVDFLLT